MTLEQREKYIDSIYQHSCLPILRKKGKDYSGTSDANANFKRNAEKMKLSKYQIWQVYWNKHVDAVNNSITDNPENPKREAESIEESVIDIINYSFIILSMLFDDQQQNEPAEDVAETKEPQKTLQIVKEMKATLKEKEAKIKFLENEVIGLHNELKNKQHKL